MKHHQQALQMIDQSMPRMQRADLKTMAERMKREQVTAIAELQRKGPGA